MRRTRSAGSAFAASVVQRLRAAIRGDPRFRSNGPCLGVALGSHRFDDQSLSWITVVGFTINWSLIALIFSGVASAVLYGLRRDVRDARRLGQLHLHSAPVVPSERLGRAVPPELEARQRARART